MNRIKYTLQVLTLWLLAVIREICRPFGSVYASNTETTYPLNNRTIVLGAALYFTRDGETETISAVQHTVSDTYLPLTGSAIFQSIGECEQLNVDVSGNALRLKASASGRYRFKRSIPLSQSMTLSGRLQDVNELAFELLFKSPASITKGTLFLPMRKVSPVTGWVKFTGYDSTNGKMMEGLLRAEIEYQGGVSMAEQQYSFNAMFMVIDNSLNSMIVPDYTAYTVP